MPSVALRELERDPDLVFDMLHLRAYARAKDLYDTFGRVDERERDRLRADPVVQLVEQTEFELMRRGPDEQPLDD